MRNLVHRFLTEGVKVFLKSVILSAYVDSNNMHTKKFPEHFKIIKPHKNFNAFVLSSNHILLFFACIRIRP